MDETNRRLEEIAERAKELTYTQQAAMLVLASALLERAGKLTDEDKRETMQVIACAYRTDTEAFERELDEVFAILERRDALEKQQSGGYYAPLTYWQMRHMPLLVSIHLR